MIMNKFHWVQKLPKGKKGGKTIVGWQRLKYNGVSPFHKKSISLFVLKL